ncbi:MAG: helix-turn-helix transcriptional regulator [Ginsengibacter sp.]
MSNILQVMKKEAFLPSIIKTLVTFGENIKLARLRRKLSAEQVAERANISRKTLWAVETGSPGVAIGTYAKVLFVLGLEKDLLEVAEDDTLGRKLQDADLVVKERSPKKPK